MDLFRRPNRQAVVSWLVARVEDLSRVDVDSFGGEFGASLAIGWAVGKSVDIEFDRHPCDRTGKSRFRIRGRHHLSAKLRV